MSQAKAICHIVDHAAKDHRALCGETDLGFYSAALIQRSGKTFALTPSGEKFDIDRVCNDCQAVAEERWR